MIFGDIILCKMWAMVFWIQDSHPLSLPKYLSTVCFEMTFPFPILAFFLDNGKSC